MFNFPEVLNTALTRGPKKKKFFKANIHMYNVFFPIYIKLVVVNVFKNLTNV